jgi:hypothetical protein
VNLIIDSVQSRRMIARTIVPCNIRALESKGLTVTDLDGIKYRVADRVSFFPRNGFWRFLDGSRQGYGASRLISALATPAQLDPMIERLRKPKIKSEKPAAGSLNISPPELTSQETNAEPVAGPNPEKLVASRDSMPEVASSIIPRSSDRAEFAASPGGLMQNSWP